MHVGSLPGKGRCCLCKFNNHNECVCVCVCVWVHASTSWLSHQNVFDQVHPKQYINITKHTSTNYTQKQNINTASPTPGETNPEKHAPQVLSLGTHILSPRFPSPTLLMEVMPQMLARRSFPTLRTDCLLVPGFRESPDPDRDMAILFCKAHKPAIVEQAEACVGASGAWVLDVLTVYNLAVMEVEEEVRDLLLVYGGYECKEPEPGKFTIAFADLEMAVRWACALQLRLLDRAWPPELLQWEECAPVEGGQGWLWRGLRVRVGMAFGRPDQRKPLNTGVCVYMG